jgi:Protein of unknown function (DUF4238)
VLPICSTGRIMQNDGKAEVQHYVPKILLRLHMIDAAAKRGREQVYVFDKKVQKVFSSNIRGVFAGTRFNEIKIGDTLISQEGPLTEVEADAAPIFERLVERKRLRSISIADRKKIASFCAVQLVRTQTFRDQIKDVVEGTQDALRKRGIDPAQIMNYERWDEDQIKKFSLEMLTDAPETYGPHFLSKYWHLVGGDAEDPFHLGDNPVVVENDVTRGASGTLGLACPGVTIYLSLSATLCLAMTDQRVIAGLFSEYRRSERNFKKIKKAASRRRDMPQEAIAALEEQEESSLRLNEHVEPLRLGTPSKYQHEVVMRVNSLQMLYASRWIVSSRPDFSLPLKMIADNPEFRERRRIDVV